MWTTLRFSLVSMLLCGAVYPVVTTLFGQVLFPEQAKGSLIVQEGHVVGSHLIGQNFTGRGYFQGRPSAADSGYNPVNASGSNLASSNPTLHERVEKDSVRLQKENGVLSSQIPANLLAASGSGLDPHITPEGAFLQIQRVAQSRGLSKAAIQELVHKHIHHDPLGPDTVNVLELNLALDRLK